MTDTGDMFARAAERIVRTQRQSVDAAIARQLAVGVQIDELRHHQDGRGLTGACDLMAGGKCVETVDLSIRISV